VDVLQLGTSKCSAEVGPEMGGGRKDKGKEEFVDTGDIDKAEG
jgi:hypothetical protein